jgi:hypothetical protein
MEATSEVSDLGAAARGRASALRRASDAGLPPEPQGEPYTRPHGPFAPVAPFAMVCPAAKRSNDTQTYLDQLCQVNASIAPAYALILPFPAMVRERRGRRPGSVNGRGDL